MSPSFSAVTVILALTSANWRWADGYNILGLFPYPGRSHYIVFDSLMVELARRGHNVTVYNPFPKPVRAPNYTEVDLGRCFSLSHTLSLPEMSYYGADTWYFTGRTLFEFMPRADEWTNCSPLRQLWNASDRYDLMITETFNTNAFLLFAYRLGVPVIAFHSSRPYPWMCHMVAMPDNPSYIPHTHSGFVKRLNFFQRVENAALHAYSWLAYVYKSERFYDRLASDTFGPHLPPIGQLATNVSMLFLYTHFSVNEARPTVPAVAHVAGLNIKPARSLPQEIEKFINESKDGECISAWVRCYVGKHFPKKKEKHFCTLFQKYLKEYYGNGRAMCCLENPIKL